MVPHGEKRAYICEKCGCEAELVIREEKVGPSSARSPKKGTLVYKVCGSEADIILEEI